MSRPAGSPAFRKRFMFPRLSFSMQSPPKPVSTGGHDVGCGFESRHIGFESGLSMIRSSGITAFDQVRSRLDQ